MIIEVGDNQVDDAMFSLNKDGLSGAEVVSRKEPWLWRLSKKVKAFFMAKKQKRKSATLKKDALKLKREDFEKLLHEFAGLRKTIISAIEKKKDIESGSIKLDLIGICAACEKNLTDKDITVISETDHSFLNFIACTRCKVAYSSLINIAPEGITVKNFESEVDTAAEFKKFLKEEPISVDDVIDASVSIRNGGVEQMIKEMYGIKKEKKVSDKNRR